MQIESTTIHPISSLAASLQEANTAGSSRSQWKSGFESNNKSLLTIPRQTIQRDKQNSWEIQTEAPTQKHKHPCKPRVIAACDGRMSKQYKHTVDRRTQGKLHGHSGVLSQLEGGWFGEEFLAIWILQRWICLCWSTQNQSPENPICDWILGREHSAWHKSEPRVTIQIGKRGRELKTGKINNLDTTDRGLCCRCIQLGGF